MTTPERTAELLAEVLLELDRPVSNADSDRWRGHTAPPDYLDRHLVLGLRSLVNGRHL